MVQKLNVRNADKKARIICQPVIEKMYNGTMYKKQKDNKEIKISEVLESKDPQYKKYKEAIKQHIESLSEEATSEAKRELKIVLKEKEVIELKHY